MGNYKIEIELNTSIIQNSPRTLDAIIGGMIYQTHGSYDPSDLETYIEVQDDIPLASLMMINTIPMSQTAEVFINNTRTIFDGSYNNIFSNAKSGMLNLYKDKYDSHNPYNNILTEMNKIKIKSVFFYATCNERKISELLSLVRNIGTKTGVGFGKIKSVKFTEVLEQDWKQYDNDVFGVVHKGKLMRNVPSAWRNRETYKNNIETEIGRFSNPYSPFMAKKYGYDITEIYIPSTHNTFLIEV